MMMIETPQRRIRALLEMENVDRIHNDLSNAAHFLTERISQRLADNDRRGISLEMMAALVLIAFTMEANLNFIGDAKVEGWKEFMRFDKKLRIVFDAIGLDPDLNTRPYATIARLKLFRDTLAHGKPKIESVREEVTGTHDELTARVRSHKSALEQMLTDDFVTEAYDDVEAIWKEMLFAAKINAAETWTGGSSSIEFLSFADEQ